MRGRGAPHILAASLGLVRVLAGEQAPGIMLVAFVPSYLIAVAHREAFKLDLAAPLVTLAGADFRRARPTEVKVQTDSPSGVVSSRMVT